MEKLKLLRLAKPAVSDRLTDLLAWSTELIPSLIADRSRLKISEPFPRCEILNRLTKKPMHKKIPSHLR